jgi:hypothetical protein
VGKPSAGHVVRLGVVVSAEVELLQAVAVRDVSDLLVIEQVTVTTPPMVVEIRGCIRVTPVMFEDPNRFDLFIRDAARAYVDLLAGIEEGSLRFWTCPTFEISGEISTRTRKPIFYRADVTLALIQR